MRRMRIFFPALILVALFSACQQSMEPLTLLTQSSNDDPVKPSNDSKACFPGREQTTCVTRVSREALGSHSLEYNYLDPYTDSTFPRGLSKDQYRRPAHFLDAQALSTSLPLSDNFQFGEFVQSYKGRYGFFSALAVRQLQRMRSEIQQPILIHSAYRSPQYNSRLTGAAKWSRHMYGDAVDFHAKNTSYAELAQLCIKHGASYYQLYSGHIHCDWRGTELDSNFYDPAPRGVQPTTVFQQMAQLAEISVTTEETKAGEKQVVFSVSVIQEDEGELLYNWEIVTPDGQEIRSEQAEPTAPYIPGTYSIRVIVGGGVVIERYWTLSNS